MAGLSDIPGDPKKPRKRAKTRTLQDVAGEVVGKAKRAIRKKTDQLKAESNLRRKEKERVRRMKAGKGAAGMKLDYATDREGNPGANLSGPNKRRREAIQKRQNGSKRTTAKKTTMARRK